ncbi:MAG: bifunctional phosphopantothenoylcysteine decarboxylase/phosphopantothenate--cysteine ligase CoaBC [Bacteroidia bacterium]|nr:bifunctional phosphopantothenoylcysteine decarboxylase/phosphopantothenate--cysteine ligase CoaBC [Bacteroidia bacterium]
MLKNKKIVLCVTGSIAAYKSAYIIRLLVKQGAEVKVVMTESAKNFITPLTLSTLSKNLVYSDNFDKETGKWINHVELAKWADLLLIAPASANTIAKLANGLCDNFLCAVYLSANCPIVVSPAMDLDMYKHNATIKNIKYLKESNCKIIPAEYGELASGLTGDGRMAEPENIVSFIEDLFVEKKKLKKYKVLVSAGPTQEMIDPVRYISNHSSGKMGVNIANYFSELGAEVTLVAGPIEKLEIENNIKKIDVVSALQMKEQCILAGKESDIIVMAAAVADYTPSEVSKVKIKKKTDKISLSLKKTSDILYSLGKNKKENQILVGFALENFDELNNAIEKLKNKNLDMIVLNSINDKGAGFKSDYNKITIINKNLKKKSYELKTKKQVASDIVDEIIKLIN